MEIREGHRLWERLYNAWKDQKEPGWVTLRGSDQYKVYRPSDDEVFFVKHSGFDAYYGDQSSGSLTNG